MIVSSILLTKDDKYIDSRGKLPERPYFDKDLLTFLCMGKSVSKLGYNTLPHSIKVLTNVTEGEPEIGITIPEINGLTDLLIVVRSPESCNGGKEFDLHRSFKNIMKDESIELWIRKEN